MRAFWGRWVVFIGHVVWRRGVCHLVCCRRAPLSQPCCAESGMSARVFLSCVVCVCVCLGFVFLHSLSLLTWGLS